LFIRASKYFIEITIFYEAGHASVECSDWVVIIIGNFTIFLLLLKLLKSVLLWRLLLQTWLRILIAFR